MSAIDMRGGSGDIQLWLRLLTAACVGFEDVFLKMIL